MWFWPLLPEKNTVSVYNWTLKWALGGDWGSVMVLIYIQPLIIFFLMDSFLYHDRLILLHKHMNSRCSKMGASRVRESQQSQGKLYHPKSGL